MSQTSNTAIAVIGIYRQELVPRRGPQGIDVQAAHHVAHVERSSADLHRGGRHRGGAAGAGVTLATARRDFG
jgi:hypothetical protein